MTEPSERHAAESFDRSDPWLLYDIGDLARALGGDETSFTGDLLRLIAKAQATPVNLIRLNAGFGREVLAYHLWMSSSAPPSAEGLLAQLRAAGW